LRVVGDVISNDPVAIKAKYIANPRQFNAVNGCMAFVDNADENVVDVIVSPRTFLV
jgi:hypothetical protein